MKTLCIIDEQGNFITEVDITEEQEKFILQEGINSLLRKHITAECSVKAKSITRKVKKELKKKYKEKEETRGRLENGVFG